LIDALQLVLDGIYHRDEIVLGGGDLSHGRIESRGFTRAGRTRHQDHAVRRVDGAPVIFKGFILKA
jgi:hypothetical protein